MVNVVLEMDGRRTSRGTKRLPLAWAILTGMALLPLAAASSSADHSITANMMATAGGSASDATDDPRLLAERFIQHINYARVAIATQNLAQAQDHIRQAQAMLKALKRVAPREAVQKDVPSGRLAYNAIDAKGAYRYFPIEAGLVEVKKVDKGPFWASQGLAVTDASIVYLTLDVSGTKAEQHLAQALFFVRAQRLDDADAELAALNDTVVRAESKQALPHDIARDNIALAREFIAMKNYDSARFALNHADAALDDMEYADRNHKNRAVIRALRAKVDALLAQSARQDPTLLDRGQALLARNTAHAAEPVSGQGGSK